MTAPPEPPLADEPRAPAAWVEAGRPGLGAALGRLRAFPALLWGHRDLIVTSVRRDLAARLAGTLLGRLWPLLQPLLLFGVYYFIFTKLLGFKLPDLPAEHAPAMGVYMFLGVCVWTALADSLTRCTQVVVDNGNLIKKVAFPAELLPLNLVLAHLFTMGVALFAFVVATLVTSVWRPPGALLALFPLLLVLQAMFTAGLGFLCATCHVFLRDTAHFVAVLATMWMFATPVFWVPSPRVLPGIERWLPLVELNPMHHLLYVWRAVLMSGEPALCFEAPIARSLGIFAACALALFAIGYLAFSLCVRRFADEV